MHHDIRTLFPLLFVAVAAAVLGPERSVLLREAGRGLRSQAQVRRCRNGAGGCRGCRDASGRRGRVGGILSPIRIASLALSAVLPAACGDRPDASDGTPQAAPSPSTGSATPRRGTRFSAGCPTCGWARRPCLRGGGHGRPRVGMDAGGRAPLQPGWPGRRPGGFHASLQDPLRGLPVLRPRPVEVHLVSLRRHDSGDRAQPAHLGRLAGVRPADGCAARRREPSGLVAAFSVRLPARRRRPRRQDPLFRCAIPGVG